MGTELKDTFVQAYNDTYDYINRYLTSKLPTRDLIEDALQSVYLDFYRSLITTEGKIKNVRHYVLRIAKHYVADHYRQQPKATFEDITDLNIPDEKALATLENADFFDYEQVMSYLKSSDDTTYRIFVLHYQYGYTIKKTASCLGLSQSTVKSRLYRTLDKLKKTYCEKEEQSNENDRYNENLDAILQKIDNKAFITNSADSAHTETKPQPIKLRRKSVGIAAAAACAAIAVGAFAFSGLLKPDIDATTPAPSTASTDTTTQPPQTPQPITVPDVTNKTYAEAEKLIAQAGGTPVRRDRYSDTVAAETVMNTEPAAGEEIQAGQEVNLFVSKGPVPEQRTYIHNDSSQTDSDEQTDKQLTEDELGTYEAADIEIPTFTERLTDLENTDDLDIILSALNSRASDFGIISAENHETYLDVTVNTENDVTCTKAYLQAYGINIDLVDVHTAYPEPTGELPVSDTPITNPYKVSNLLCDLEEMGYRPTFTSCGIYDQGNRCEVTVLYEHNIKEMEELLQSCNVEMSIVTITLGGKAEVTPGYRSPREILEEVKDVFHINDVRIAITGKTSYVDAYAIDISDTEKLADIAGYITSYFSDDILYSIPISLNGSDYFFVHK